LAVLAVILLLTLARLPEWRDHMQVDIGAFHGRSSHFLTHGTWQGVGYDEYQPGALWFFVLLGWLSFAPSNYDAFFAMLMVANVLLIFGHVAFFLRNGSRWAALSLVLLAAAAGPILLFRFELLVSLLVLCAWALAQRRSYIASAIVLGVATVIKVYPAVFLPLLLAEVLRRKQYADSVAAAAGFGLGIIVPTLLTMAYGFPLPEIIQSVQVHQLKPIGLEGLWANIIVPLQALLHIPLRMTPAYGVHGLTSDLPHFGNWFFGNIWMLPTGLTFLAILWTHRKKGYSEPAPWLLLLFAFTLFAKVLNPQYLWWFLSLLPLVAFPALSRRTWIVCLVFAAASLILTQIIYPLYYTEFLDWFYKNAPYLSLFVIMAARNLLLLALFIVLCVKALPAKQRISHS